VQTRSVFLEYYGFDLLEVGRIRYKINIFYINDHNRVRRLAIEKFKIRILYVFKVDCGDVTLIASVPDADLV
jgi:hypothetical protein